MKLPTSNIALATLLHDWDWPELAWYRDRPAGCPGAWRRAPRKGEYSRFEDGRSRVYQHVVHGVAGEVSELLYWLTSTLRWGVVADMTDGSLLAPLPCVRLSASRIVAPAWVDTAFWHGDRSRAAARALYCLSEDTRREIPGLVALSGWGAVEALLEATGARKADPYP